MNSLPMSSFKVKLTPIRSRSHPGFSQVMVNSFWLVQPAGLTERLATAGGAPVTISSITYSGDSINASPTNARILNLNPLLLSRSDTLKVPSAAPPAVVSSTETVETYFSLGYTSHCTGSSLSTWLPPISLVVMVIFNS